MGDCKLNLFKFHKSLAFLIKDEHFHFSFNYTKRFLGEFEGLLELFVVKKEGAEVDVEETNLLVVLVVFLEVKSLVEVIEG